MIQEVLFEEQIAVSRALSDNTTVHNGVHITK